MLLAVTAFFFLSRNNKLETLPDHLGLFVQNNERNHLDEVLKQDITNVIQAKNELLKNEDLPTVDANPNFILNYDGKDVPINDLKLIQLDTIKDDGSMKQISFQPAPIDGKPEMKRVRVPDSLANGKYALALLDGFFNDGKHKFWTFQVKNSSRSDNGDALKSSTASLKPTPPAQPVAPKTPAYSPPSSPASPPPVSGGMATVRSGNVILRSGPCLTCTDIGRVYGGQQVFIINYGGSFDTWKGRRGNWAYVRTSTGSLGWVFAALLR